MHGRKNTGCLPERKTVRAVSLFVSVYHKDVFCFAVCIWDMVLIQDLREFVFFIVNPDLRRNEHADMPAAGDSRSDLQPLDLRGVHVPQMLVTGIFPEFFRCCLFKNRFVPQFDIRQLFRNRTE